VKSTRKQKCDNRKKNIKQRKSCS